MSRPRGSMWKWALTSTLVLSSVLESQAAAGGQQQALQPRISSSQLVPAHLSSTGVSPDVLIVSLLDGHVVALDQATGRTLWSFDSGAPLVSAKQSFASSQGLNVFPGTDGGLYAYHGITHLNPGLERLPISLPELVESAPSLTADGSIILGRRDSKVFLLDCTTGRRVHTISNAAEALEDHSSSLGLTMGVPLDQLLALGRQDYVVRSVRMDTKAETWNATFSRLYLIPSGASPSSIQDFLQEGRPAPAGPAGAGLPHLVVGTDNSLQAFDPQTMLLKWYVAFDTPPVSAYRPDGRGGNALDPEQAGRAALGGSSTGQDGSSSWLVPSPSSPRARPPMPAGGGGGRLGVPRRKVKGHLAGGTSVLVGALHGSLYALPADHLMLSAAAAGAAGEDEGSSTGPARTAAVVWPKRTGRMPLDITPAVVDVCAAGSRTAAAGKEQLPGRSGAAGGSADGGSSGGGGPNSSDEGDGGSALALLDDSDSASGVVQLNPVDSGAVLDELGTLTCPQPPLGIHSISVQQGQQVGWLPLAAVQEVDQEQQYRPSPTGWLAGISRRLLWTLVALLVAVPLLLYGAWGQGHNAGAAAAARHRPGLPLHPQLQAASAPLALPAPGGAAAAKGAASPAGKKKSKHKHKTKQQQEATAAAAATTSSSNGARPRGLSSRDMHADAASSSSGSSTSAGGNQQQQESSGRKQGGSAGSNDSQQKQNGSAEPLASSSGSTVDKAAVQQSGSTAPGLSEPEQHQQQGGPSSMVGGDQPAVGSNGRSVGVSPDLTPVQTDSTPTSPLPPAQEAAAAAAALSPSGAVPSTNAAAPAPAPAGGPGHMMQQHRSYVDADGAVVIGRLRVGPKELGFGSAGTIVYEGVLDSRPVAVKRLLRQFYTLARKEINVLVVSDEHPNVVRCFAMEEDREFVYLALERCKTSLAAFINDQGGAALLTDAASGAATPWCMSVLSDTAAGLAALHARQIVHRDLKPHNVLLTESGRAKLSDMGLSKQLVSEQSSFESHGSGGSSGWQAPEQLIAKDGGTARQSRAIDVFSLGCIMFYCLSGGKHPFGEHYERDTNIIRGHCNLGPLARWPEAVNLLGAMLSKQPLQRPAMAGVLAHPFWWSDEQRLAFLVDVSDRVENEDREPDPTLLNALESFAPPAVGTNWGAAVDVELITNLGRYRRYDYTCLRDLLRVVRNKRNHFREMPDSLQQLMGPLPNGFYRYFSNRFPMLLLGVFFFALQNLSDDPNLAKYFTPPAGESAGQQVSDAGLEPGACFLPFKRPWDSMAAKAARASKLALAAAGGGGAESGLAAAAAAAGAAAGRGNSRRNSGSMANGPSPSKLGPAGGPAAAAAGYQLPPLGPSAAGRSSGGGAAAAAAAAATAAGRGPPGSPPHQVPVWPPGLPRGANLGTPPPPPPPPPPHGSSSGGTVPATAAAAADGGGCGSSSVHGGGGGGAGVTAAGSISDGGAGGGGGGTEVVVGYQVAEGQEVLHVVPFPSRPGKQLCEFYAKTGHCKFGEECVFDHPPEYGVPLTEDELPFRPGQPMCTYYYKTRHCKFGPSCKFHHPKLVPILAGSAVLKQQ